MTHPQNPAGAAQPTPEQQNRISAQLRDLNAAYKAAVAANGKAQGAFTPGPKPERRDDRDSPSWSLPLWAAATTAVNAGSCAMPCLPLGVGRLYFKQRSGTAKRVPALPCGEDHEPRSPVLAISAPELLADDLEVLTRRKPGDEATDGRHDEVGQSVRGHMRVLLEGAGDDLVVQFAHDAVQSGVEPRHL